NATAVNSAPSSNLCSAGAASSVTGNGPWSWSCAGSNGGTSASCSATVSTGGTGINCAEGSHVDPTSNQCVADTTPATGVSTIKTKDDIWRYLYGCVLSNPSPTSAQVSAWESAGVPSVAAAYQDFFDS